MSKIYLIVAVDSKNGIAKNGEIPWDIPEDRVFFKKITTTNEGIPKIYENSLNSINNTNVLIMGNNTKRTIKNKLNRRKIVVVSRKEEIEDYDVISLDSLRYYTVLNKFYNYNNIYIIGGEKIYKHFIENDIYHDGVILTRINDDYKCDQFFPMLPNNYDITCYFKLTDKASVFFYETNKEVSKNESIYLNLLKNVLNNGEQRSDRTNTGVLSTFGEFARYNLKNNKIPLLTTKRVPWKMVIKELLWFLKGDTNVKNLQKQNVHIWDLNSSREFLDKVGLPYEEGFIGPMYGFQWIHWGANYPLTETNEYQGINQIKKVIESIIKDPFGRRHIVSTWNVGDINKMALPPCHVLFQFYVGKDHSLSCSIYQRSCDMFLGVPFNIASYAILTHMVAHVTGLHAKELIHYLGDTHIYTNHLEQVKKQLSRNIYNEPIITLNKNISNIFDFKLEDINVLEYQCHGKLSAEMCV
jgi:thymidylate synthase/dihydrofolate reductase